MPLQISWLEIVATAPIHCGIGPSHTNRKYNLALQDYSHVLGAITIVGWLLKTACNSVQLHVLDRDTNAVRKQLASRLPVLAILLLPEKLPVLPALRL